MRAVGRVRDKASAVSAPKRRRQRCHECQEVVSLAAHDMKTPLAVLNGYIELLLSGRLGEVSHSQHDILLQMQSSGERLEQVLDESLSFSALKAGSFTPRFETGRLDECIAEMAAFWGPCFLKRGITFRVLNQGSIEPFKFDAHKTQRVLSNLLENALRLTPSGGLVTIASEEFYWERRGKRQSVAAERRRNREHAPNAVLITVSDTGPGIAAEHQEHIFTEYFRVVPPGEQPGGTGLGLAIARSLMTALHGKIWVESKLGHGSTFSVVLPMRPE